MNTALTADFLTGDHITVADIFVFIGLSFAFQTIFDGGFRKAMPKAAAWFERVAADKSVVAVVGHIKMAAKMIKPIVKAAPKVEKAKKAAAPKPAAEAAPKKDVNPLDALPPSKFDLYNFKTLFVNHPEKAIGGMEALKEQFDPEGYSLWFIHYDKYKGEGVKLYMTENMLAGFIQRIDHFRKHAFARMCVLGKEPELEIEGVWLFRGTTIPQEMIDHPQFEYYQPRKLDINVEADYNLVKDFWSAEEEGTANGQFVQSVHWHK